MAAPGAGAAPAPAASAAGPAAAGPANAQALIAKHAAQTQSASDAGIVARVENSIKHSPLGWLQSQMGEVSARQSSEGGEINGKVAESRDIIAQNADKAPKDAGPPPPPGPAAHPAVPHPAAAPAVSAQPHPAGGGAPAAPAHAPAQSVQHAAAAPAAVAMPPGLSAQLAVASGDPQIDAILNSFSPKSEEVPATFGRIKQMGDVAKGFSGQLETYVAGSNAAERAFAASANFLGAGKEAGAIWANNPYRQMHGSLSGIMTGVSAIKNVAALVGSITGKLGMILTVVGLLGMIFPPVGAAVSGIARILNVVSIICDAVGFALSAVLTALNGVQLAQQIASGSSAEEKAATADMLMSESLDAASGLTSMIQDFGGGFMKGLMKSSKGVIGSLIRRAKAVIGRVTSSVSSNVKSFATRVFRKMGMGGVGAERVAGAWVEKPGMFGKMSAAVQGIPQRVQGFQDKLMAKYGDTGWAKRLDRVGAWSSSTAERFDIQEKITKAGENAGSRLNSAGADSGWSRRFNAGTDRVERETREAAARVSARDAGDLEKRRWENTIQSRRDTRAAGSVTEEHGNEFANKQGQRVEQSESARLAEENKGEKRRQTIEAKHDEHLEHETEEQREAYSHGDHKQTDQLERARRKTVRAERREALEAMPARTPEEQKELTALSKTHVNAENARDTSNERDLAFSRMVGQGDEGFQRLHGWGDVAHNTKGVYHQWKELEDDKEKEKLREHGLEWTKKHASVGKNAEGEGVSMEQSRNEVTTERAHALSAFVAKTPRTATLAGRVRSRLAMTGRTPAKAPPSAPASAPVSAPPAAAAPVSAAPAAPVATAPVSAPAAAPAAPVGVVAPGSITHEESAVSAPAAAAPASAAAAPAPDAAGGDALPFWPALMPQFQSAAGDFDYMRRVGVEFKKAQIEGKQKAVTTLGIYGKYQEYAKLRQQQAQQQAGSARQTGAETQANTDHAGAGVSSASQGEAKQGEAKGQANNRAAVDLPEPEVTGFWGRLLGQVKIWARNKAAAVMGWIQDKIASLILQGLCGVSMGDLRDYTGALRRQQAAAHGVAEGAGETAQAAGTKQVKLGTDANAASQEAVQQIGECDQNIVDADGFLADITQFEGQLNEEKTNAQTFIAQVHAQARSEQANAKRESEQKAAQEAAQQQQQQQIAPAAAPQVAAGPVAGVAAGPAASDAAAAAPAAGAAAPAIAEDHAAAPEHDEAATEDIRQAQEMVASEGESMVQQLEARGEDYINQLAVADAKGKDRNGVDLRAPAKVQTKHIVEEFKQAVEESKREIAHMTAEGVDPSSARRIADSVISAAEHLDMTYDEAQHSLDLLFARTYGAIRAGRDQAAAAAPAAGAAA